MALYVVVGLAVIGALTNHPDAPHAQQVEQVGGAGGGTVLLVLVAVLVVALASRGARRGRGASGRMVAGHAHGPSRTIARHEAGHAAAARALGGRVVSATADRRGGYVHAVLPGAPPREAARADVAFLRAGRYAAGSSAGCGVDDRSERDALRRLPANQRGQARREGDRDARRIVRRHHGQIQRDARTLERTGELWRC